MRVLLVEDYAPLRKTLYKGLREAGFAVDVAADGEEGRSYAESNEYDAIILDILLPKLDGLSLLQRLREQNIGTHVLLLTAKDAVEDRVAGLNLGADDYLVKPFAFEELRARIQALVRRKYNTKSPTLRIADLHLDLAAKRVVRAGRVIELTAHEYRILEFLAMMPGKVATRAMIWSSLYDTNTEAESNVIEVYIANLRKKLEEGDLTRLIHTRRGLGYVLEEPR